MKTLPPKFFADASIYIKLSPKGGLLVVPDFGVGVFVFIDALRFESFPALFLSLHSNFYKSSRYVSALPVLILVVSVICFFIFGIFKNRVFNGYFEIYLQ